MTKPGLQRLTHIVDTPCIVRVQGRVRGIKYTSRITLSSIHTDYGFITRFYACLDSSLILQITRCPERLANAGHADNITAVNAFTAVCLPLPRGPTDYQFRPERVGPALHRAHCIDSAPPPGIQKNTCACIICYDQIAIFKTPEIMAPEPSPGQPEVCANCLRLVPRQVDMVARPAGTASPAPGTGKSQWVLFIVRAHRGLRLSPMLPDSVVSMKMMTDTRTCRIFPHGRGGL